MHPMRYAGSCTSLTNEEHCVQKKDQVYGLKPEFYNVYLSIILQVRDGPVLQNLQHIHRHGSGLGEIMLPIIAALLPLGTGNLALEGGDKSKTVLHQADGVLPAHGVTQKEIKACTAAHGADINHSIGKFAAAHAGGKEVLKGMDGAIGEIISGVRLFHADVISDDITVNAGDIHTFFQSIVIH